MSSSRFVIGFVSGAAVSLSVVYALWYFGNPSSGRSSARRNDVSDDDKNDQNERSRDTGEHKGMFHLPSALSIEKRLHFRSSDAEKSTTFFSDLIRELWHHIDVYLSAMIRETVEPILSTTLPAPLSSLKFTKLSLGRVPIRLENVIVAHHAENRMLVGGDAGNQTSTPVKIYVDVVWHARCDIRLEGTMGIAMGVEQISLSGKLACLVHPMSSSPIVSAVNVSFVNVPTIDLNFTGLAAVADVQMIKRKVVQGVQQAMADVMVLPKSMVVRVDPAASFVDVYNPPRGILRVGLVSGSGFQVEKRLMFGKDDIVDVYCVLSLGDKTWTSSTVDNSLRPEWNESFDFLYHDLEQVLIIHAWDRDQGALDPDDHLGVVFVKVSEALSAPNKTLNVELSKSTLDTSKTGIILTMTFESMALTNQCTSITSSGPAVEPNHVRGVVEILVLGVHDLPVPKSSASSYVKVQVGTHEFVTGTVVDAPGIDALNPQYDSGFLVTLQNAEDFEGDIVLTVYNAQASIGSHSVSIRSLLDLPGLANVRRKPLGKSGGTLEFCCWVRATEVVHRKIPDKARLPPSNQLPVSSPSREGRSHQGGTSIASETIIQSPPMKPSIPKSIVTRKNAIGKVRVTVVKGYGFKPQRGLFRRVDVPDVYCQLAVVGATEGDEPASSPWRTKTIRNSVNPVWDESSVFSYCDEQDVIAISVYDEDRARLNGDDLIGNGRIAISSALTYCSPASAKQRRPFDVSIARKGKGTVAFIALVVERI